MNYTVVWAPAAERELMEHWLAAADRAALTAAADEIDQRLANSPADEGESRSPRFHFNISRSF